IWFAHVRQNRQCVISVRDVHAASHTCLRLAVAPGPGCAGGLRDFPPSIRGNASRRFKRSSGRIAAAAKASPSFAEAHFNLGLVREEQGRFEEAIVSLQKSLMLKPRLHGANLFLGVACYRINRFESALAAVKKETVAYPKDAAAWMWEGVIELAMDKPEDA